MHAHAKDEVNDFYDLLELLLLRDINFLFVTDDRTFYGLRSLIQKT